MTAETSSMSERDPLGGLPLAVMLSSVVHLTLFLALPAMESVFRIAHSHEPPVIQVLDAPQEPTPEVTPTPPTPPPPSPTPEPKSTEQTAKESEQKDAAKTSDKPPEEEGKIEKPVPLPTPGPAPKGQAPKPEDITKLPPVPHGTGNTDHGEEKIQGPLNEQQHPRLEPAPATGVRQDMAMNAQPAEPDDPSAVAVLGKTAPGIAIPPNAHTFDKEKIDGTQYILALSAVLKRTVWEGLPTVDENVVDPVVRLTIQRDGTVYESRLVVNSGSEPINDAVSGLRGKMTVPLPDEYRPDMVTLSFVFQLRRS
ncbi:MAG: hypothetical protein U0166_20750 [Acidobacteriota bacterium]